MAFFTILTTAMPIIDRILDLIPDPNARAKAREELMFKLAEIEAQERMSQVELNKTEAAHKSIFVAGWRPFIGWVGGVALAWTFILHPLAVWGATIFGYAGEFPALETDELMSLVMAMLGIGAMRSFDKYKGVSTERIGAPKPKPKSKPHYNE